MREGIHVRLQFRNRGIGWDKLIKLCLSAPAGRTPRLQSDPARGRVVHRNAEHGSHVLRVALHVEKVAVPEAGSG